MDWKKVAMEDLRHYNAQRQSLDNIREKVSVLHDRFTSAKGSVMSVAPTHGGGTQMEDKLLDNIVERERLKATYKATKRLVELIERGLAGLDDRERKVLDWFFIYPSKYCVDKLKKELGYEKSQVYRLRDEALYTFTITMYGLIDY